MFCSNCGRELPNTAKFCSYCGTSLVNEKSYNKIYKKSYEEVDEKTPKMVNKNKIDKVQLRVIILSIFATILICVFVIIKGAAEDAQMAKDIECKKIYFELFDDDESNDVDAWERYKTLKENGDLPGILSTKEMRREAKEIEKLAKEKGIISE